MALEDNLAGLPNEAEVSNALAGLRSYVSTLGVKVVDDYSTPDHARFVGLFEKLTITLFPLAAPPFARWFTIAHLYGHMAQLVNKTARVQRANALVVHIGELAPDDVQLIYDHEREAAEIGRALVDHVDMALSPAMDLAYNRFFHADFHYLVNAIETGERGSAVFARFWKREPIPREVIRADVRPLLNLKTIPVLEDRIVVI